MANLFDLHVLETPKTTNIALNDFVGNFGVILASVIEFPRGGYGLPGGVENFHVIDLIIVDAESPASGPFRN